MASSVRPSTDVSSLLEAASRNRSLLSFGIWRAKRWHNPCLDIRWIVTSCNLRSCKRNTERPQERSDRALAECCDSPLITLHRCSILEAAEAALSKECVVQMESCAAYYGFDGAIASRPMAVVTASSEIMVLAAAWILVSQAKSFGVKEKVR